MPVIALSGDVIEQLGRSFSEKSNADLVEPVAPLLEHDSKAVRNTAVHALAKLAECKIGLDPLVAEVGSPPGNPLFSTRYISASTRSGIAIQP